MHLCKCIPSQKQFLKLIFFFWWASWWYQCPWGFRLYRTSVPTFQYSAWPSELNVPNDQHKMLQNHGLVLLLLLRLTTENKQWQQKPRVKQFWRRTGLFVCTPSSQGRQRGHLKLCPHLIYSQKQRERKVCPLSLEPKLRPWFHHQWKGLCTSIHVIRTVLQRQPRRASWSRQPLTEIFFPGGSVLCQVDT